MPKGPSVFVKGGTTTTEYDRQVARDRADTERRRDYQDSQWRVAKSRPDETIYRTKLLGGRNHYATIVLAAKHPKDNEILEWMTCELIQQDDQLVLMVVCLRCVFRLGRPQGESQIKIEQKNRQFYFTPELPKWAKGERIWVNPADPNDVVTLAGSVTMPEWAHCPHLGCGWTFTIDDSVIYTK